MLVAASFPPSYPIVHSYKQTSTIITTTATYTLLVLITITTFVHTYLCCFFATQYFVPTCWPKMRGREKILYAFRQSSLAAIARHLLNFNNTYIIYVCFSFDDGNYFLMPHFDEHIISCLNFNPPFFLFFYHQNLRSLNSYLISLSLVSIYLSISLLYSC